MLSVVDKIEINVQGTRLDWFASTKKKPAYDFYDELSDRAPADIHKHWRERHEMKAAAANHRRKR